MNQLFRGIIPCLMTLFALACTPQLNEGEFLVEGEISNMPDSAVIELWSFSNGLGTLFLTDTLIDGKFVFRANLDTLEQKPEIISISSRSDGYSTTRVNLYLESKSYLKIKGSDGRLGFWNIKSNNPKQAEQSAYLASVDAENLETLETLSVEQNRLMSLVTKEKNYAKYRPAIDSLRKLQQPIHASIHIQKLEYLKSIPITEYWLSEFATYARYKKYDKDSVKIALIDEIYATIPSELFAEGKGAEIYAFMNPPRIVEAGEMMADGVLYDTDGKSHQLSDFKGKYLLLDFWSIGCGPCIMSIPEMERMIKRYADKLTVVGITSDPMHSWRKFVADKQMGGEQMNECSNISPLKTVYGVIGVPTYVLINPEGVIVKKWFGYRKGWLKNKLGEELDDN